MGTNVDDAGVKRPLSQNNETGQPCGGVLSLASGHALKTSRIGCTDWSRQATHFHQATIVTPPLLLICSAGLKQWAMGGDGWIFSSTV